MKRIVVVVGTEDRARIGEALRAALGLSLRGDRVDVVWLVPPFEHRALATLRTLGHATDAPLSTLRDADAVEVWS